MTFEPALVNNRDENTLKKTGLPPHLIPLPLPIDSGPSHYLRGPRGGSRVDSLHQAKLRAASTLLESRLCSKHFWNTSAMEDLL